LQISLFKVYKLCNAKLLQPAEAVPGSWEGEGSVVHGQSNSGKLLVSLQERGYNYTQLKKITLPGHLKRMEYCSTPSFFQGLGWFSTNGKLSCEEP